MSKKWSKIHQKDVYSIHSEDVLRRARIKVFIMSFLDVVKMFYFGCYIDVIKIRCQDVIIEHPQDIIEEARMNVIN